MKKLILGALIALSMVAFTVGATANESGEETPSTKCGEGKCSSDGTKKCGEGKCGEEKKDKSSMKCGAGKCSGGK